MSSEQPARRSTIHDVAKAAGVSYQTVSRVINNSPNVSAKTRLHVLSVIRELNYRPNQAAQVLNTQRSHVIEVVALDISTGAPAIDTMAYVARDLGYKMMISVIYEDDVEVTVNDALSRSVDGFIFISSTNHVSSFDFQAMCRNKPFVRMIAELGANVPSVVYDQRAGMKMATQHLIDLGHKQIAEISGPPENLDSVARHAGFISALEENGIKPGPRVVGRFSIQSGYDATQQLLKTDASFTAIVGANDEMAFGAISALREHGLCVPDDISLVGFDDYNFAAFSTPPLTTLRQDFRLLAKIAAEYIVELIENPATPLQQKVLIPEFIVRDSTRRID